MHCDERGTVARMYLHGFLPPGVSFWGPGAGFYHLWLMRKALISMHYAHWWLASFFTEWDRWRFTRAVELAQILRNVNRMMCDHFDNGSNSWSSHENGFSASSWAFDARTVGARTQEEKPVARYTWHTSRPCLNHMTFWMLGHCRSGTHFCLDATECALFLPVGLLVVDDQEDLGVAGDSCPVRRLR